LGVGSDAALDALLEAFRHQAGRQEPDFRKRFYRELEGARPKLGEKEDEIRGLMRRRKLSVPRKLDFQVIGMELFPIRLKMREKGTNFTFVLEW
jgi:hypothetical protein